MTAIRAIVCNKCFILHRYFCLRNVILLLATGICFTFKPYIFQLYRFTFKRLYLFNGLLGGYLRTANKYEIKRDVFYGGVFMALFIVTFFAGIYTNSEMLDGNGAL
jgi:hypothetical protein